MGIPSNAGTLLSSRHPQRPGSTNLEEKKEQNTQWLGDKVGARFSVGLFSLSHRWRRRRRRRHNDPKCAPFEFQTPVTMTTPLTNHRFPFRPTRATSPRRSLATAAERAKSRGQQASKPNEASKQGKRASKAKLEQVTRAIQRGMAVLLLFPPARRRLPVLPLLVAVSLPPFQCLHRFAAAQATAGVPTLFSLHRDSAHAGLIDLPFFLRSFRAHARRRWETKTKAPSL